jgi:16S rRNA (cytosine1402-N4)-methyltransferase
MMGEASYHIPVLLNESVSGLAIRPDGIYVDLTFGGGGHSREIIKHLSTGKLIAFDQDPAVISHLIEDQKFHFIQHNYRFLANHLHYMNIAQVDGILADLGISSEHIDNPERGFSFRFEAELDMRMNPDIPRSAADIVNQASESELIRLFREYGEVNQASRVAQLICETRKNQPITTTTGLANCLRPLVPGHKENKLLAQVFQALRIAVNQEIESLRIMLSQTAGLLREGGRLVVISYHSLEDRLVKNYIRAGNEEGTVETDVYGITSAPFRAINRKVIVPDAAEVEKNPRARSARLRIAERTQDKA